MRILMCNSFYYLRGGAERCFFDLTALLEQHGHEVIPFSMVHEQNYPSPYARYFVSGVDFPKLLQGSGIGGKVQAVERVIYARETRDKLRQLLADVKPDLAHIHGIAHEMSPSFLPALKAAGVPVVQTLHDYKLLCPNTSFVSQGQVCEACKGHRYYNVVRKRCKRGSLAASLLAGLEMYVHKGLQIYEKNVDTFISPSRFLQQKMYEYGIQNRIVHIPNFVNADTVQPRTEKEPYIVYAGRLVDVKGVRTLLQAMTTARGVRLYLAGSGELEGELRQFAQANNLTQVVFLGYLDKAALTDLVQRALCTVTPSEWFENNPMTVLESFACGTPVIGANIGGIPELVIHNQTGLLFQPGDASQLAQQIQALVADPARAVELGRNARTQVLTVNNPTTHYEQTIQVYRALLQ